MNSPTTQVERLHFYGGMHALFVPFGVMLAGIAILGVQGAAVPHAFWVVMLVSILVGLVLAKNKSVYIDALIEGIGRRAGVQGRGRAVA